MPRRSVLKDLSLARIWPRLRGIPLQLVAILLLRPSPQAFAINNVTQGTAEQALRPRAGAAQDARSSEGAGLARRPELREAPKGQAVLPGSSVLRLRRRGCGPGKEGLPLWGTVTPTRPLRAELGPISTGRDSIFKPFVPSKHPPARRFAKASTTPDQTLPQ